MVLAADGMLERLLQLGGRCAARRGQQRCAGIVGVDPWHAERRDHRLRRQRHVPTRGVDGALRAEVRRDPRLRVTGVGGRDLVQDAGQLVGELVHGREAPLRIGVGGAKDGAVQRLVLREHRHGFGAGQLLGEPVVLQDHESRESPPDGVDVAGDGRSGPGDLGRLVAARSVDHGSRRRPWRRWRRGR